MKSSAGASQAIGTVKDASLHYLDGNITVVYIGNRGCNGTNASWRTIITFVCNRTAGDGIPRFIGQEECFYNFEWSTVHACPKQYLNSTCSLVSGNIEVDLQELHRRAGSEGWRVIDGTSIRNGKRQIFLNMCGSLETSGATSRCPIGSAICSINKLNGRAESLGRYSSVPEYDAKNGVVTMNFYGGSECSNGEIQSRIKLFCQLGDVSSSPILVKESNCFYEFEWHTYAACPKSEQKGEDCKIKNKNLGLHVDLSPLKSNVPYQAQGLDYKFFLNVCGPVKGTECNFKQKTANIGACANKLSQSGNVEHFSIGEASSEIFYLNGILSLHYITSNSSDGSKNSNGSTVILFFCDPATSKGKPLFMGQHNEWFIFHWYTNYACLQKANVDCTAVDPRTGSQYDLSSLIQLEEIGGWTAVDQIGHKRFYLNVCHLQPLCGDEASICEVDTSVKEAVARNLGRAVSSPVVQSDGHLTLTYKFGDECVSYGERVNYSSTIHFMCLKGKKEQSIRFLDTYGTCNYSFLWATEAACALDDEESQDTCSITDSVSGQMYNMKNLKLANGFYNVSSGTRRFRLNICGSVGNNVCVSVNGKTNISVCEVGINGETISILGLSEHYSFHVSEDMPVRLTYSMGNSKLDPHVEISFKCAETVSNIEFVEQLGNKYYFEMATPLACKHQAIYCSVTDPKGNYYDLNSLGHSPFRTAFDTRPKMTSWYYRISVCSPLDFSTSSTCYGTGACKLNLDHQDEMSLGYQHQMPEVAVDGSIIVRFFNGSDCPDKTGSKYTAEVRLQCAYKEKELLFVGVSSCHYKFSLETPFACPVQTYNGSNCVVKNLFTNQVFDLSPLKKVDSDYKVNHGDYSYLINVCDAVLTKDVKGCEDVGICQTKKSDPNFAINAGMPSHELLYRDGLIVLTYNSGKGNCHKKYTRSSVITFVCDYTTDGIEEGPIFVNEEEDCTYGFLWRTSHACPPFETVNCTVTNDNGETYELDTLALSSDNYYVKDPQNSNRTFAINVCRTLISQPKLRCSPSSAACVLDKNATYERSHYPAVSIGTKLSPPKFTKGKLTLSYTEGENCFLDGKESQFETVIEFKCNPKEKFTTPEFLQSDGCKYYFLWETSVACPTSTKEVVSNNCTVTNPQTGQVFNFSSLASNKSMKVVVGSTQTFYLQICGSVSKQKCGDGVGACLFEKGRIMRTGKANSMLHYQDGSFFLNYTGGDKCNGELSERNTLIRIMCSLPEETSPHFMTRRNDCTYNFVWYTPLACDRELPCDVEKDGATIDLSVLGNTANETTVFHSIRTSSTFFMNICQPLKPLSHSYCPSAAAICQVTFGTSKTLSLGRLWRSPYLNEEDNIILEYKEGSVCPRDSKKRVSSRILFICDFLAERGLPHLISINDDGCEYVFEWRTSVACTAEMLPKLPSSKCIFEDSVNGGSLDLSKLWRSEKPYEVASDKGSYLINICGSTKTEGPCKHASVCSLRNNKQESYGSANCSTLTRSGYRVLFNSESVEACNPNKVEKKTSEIIFTCHPDAGIGQPTLYKESQCSLTFLWTTSLVCPRSLPKCTYFDGKDFFDLRMFSSISHSWSLFDKEGNIYWLNICNELQHDVIYEKSHHCPSGSAVCRVGKDGIGVSIGSASSQRIMGSDVEGSLAITVEYSGSEEVCKLPNGTQTAVSTVIRLVCNNGSMEQPKFVSGPRGDCTYRFEWKTFGACPKTDVNDTSLVEEKGFVFDKRAPDLKMNLTAHIYTAFMADEVHRDKYVYLFNIGGGVKNGDNKSECYRAAVCQTKPDGSFYRDIGSVPTRHFIFRGSELHLVLRSYGKRCGKNRNKNVTTIVMFHCKPNAGIGTPEFFYESNDCDYVFNWETSAVCSTSMEDRRVSIVSRTLTHQSSVSISTEAIIGLVVSAAIIVVMIAVFAKQERRSSFLYKVKNCFHKVKLPRYRYIQSSHVDGDPILLSPDDPLQRFHEESDVDVAT